MAARIFVMLALLIGGGWLAVDLLAEPKPTDPSKETPSDPVTERELKSMYARYTPEFAAREAGVRADTIVDVARVIGAAGTALAAHNWRAAAAGNLHGWMTTRCLFFLNVLTGSVGTKGGTNPNRTNKFVPKHHTAPAHPDMWNELTWPKEYPLAFFEMSFLLLRK